MQIPHQLAGLLAVLAGVPWPSVTNEKSNTCKKGVKVLGRQWYWFYVCLRSEAATFGNLPAPFGCYGWKQTVRRSILVLLALIGLYCPSGCMLSIFAVSSFSLSFSAFLGNLPYLAIRWCWGLKHFQWAGDFVAPNNFSFTVHPHFFFWILTVIAYIKLHLEAASIKRVRSVFSIFANGRSKLSDSNGTNKQGCFHTRPCSE